MRSQSNFYVTQLLRRVFSLGTFICASFNVLGGVYTLEGESKIVLDTLSSHKLPTNVELLSFTIQLESAGNNWLMTSGDHVSIYYDGTNVAVLDPGGAGVGTDHKAIDNADIYPGPIPFGGDGHPQGLWLAYCSKSSLQNTNEKFPDLAMAGIIRPDPSIGSRARSSYYDSFDVEISTNGITKLLLFRAVGGKRLLGEELSVHSYVTLNGLPFPKDFEYTIFSRKETNKVWRQIAVSIQRAAYNPNGQLAPPRIADSRSQIGDFRIKGSIMYMSTNWRSEQDIRSDPLLGPKIKLVEGH